MNKIICIYITCKDKIEARNIAKALLEEKLIASANILPQIESLFYFGETLENNKFYNIEEAVLLLFCKEENFEIVKEKTIALHSYILPCIISLPIDFAHKEFQNWVRKED